ncbi:deoxynucleoside kinase [Brevibacillus humidisoli]|uniref:deoxynucleoside kinase n=1 Tax=Brevibacillus humidisoli TaxID=2895522 RepID=UPI001E30DA76|nr:deoxynucleoside kinase [Brevibacillus humidisoli]UFJ43080.1 deoxynucleoside kinase [Brevibacillus humidisoli]
MSSVFITVEGPIGVGKTSLAQAIAREYGLNLLQEIVYENPFLGKFYENIEEWGFQLEMFFLCNRYKQLQDISRHHLSQGRSVVSDYNIFKNTIFAQRTLDDENLPKYLQIYDILTSDLPQADLVIYLHASVDTLMKRIAMRGRDVEGLIDRRYMENLAADYARFMDEFRQRHPQVPVLSFACDQLDYVHRPDDLRYVLRQIEPFLKQATSG